MGGEIVGGQRPGPIKLVRRLAVEPVLDEEAALSKTAHGLVVGSILAHEAVPIPKLAKFVFHGLGRLNGTVPASLQILIALQVDLGNAIGWIQIQRLSKVGPGLRQLAIPLHLRAPIVERTGVEAGQDQSVAVQFLGQMSLGHERANQAALVGRVTPCAPLFARGRVECQQRFESGFINAGPELLVLGDDILGWQGRDEVIGTV